MRVAMYYRNSDVRIEEMPRPSAGAGEILVRAMACGICGTDVLEWYRVKKAPLVLGHEMAGVIEETGPGVSAFRRGERVFVSHHVPCNTCRWCLSGHATACETLHSTKYHPGGFAEYVRVPAINVDRGVFRLPESMSFDEATFIEPVACVLRGQRALGVEPGASVLVVGSGISGLLHVALARAAGATRIVATDINPRRLELARELGADATVDAREDIPARVREILGGRLPGRVVLCTGAMSAARQAMASVDRGGTLLFFAVPTEDVPVPMSDYWRNDVTIRTSYAADGRDIAGAMELIRAGRVPCSKMITHVLPLAKAQEGFMLVAKAEDSVKVIIRPCE